MYLNCRAEYQLQNSVRGTDRALSALSLLWETLLSSTSCNSHKIVTGGCACLGWFCIKHWTGPQSIPGQHRDTGRIRTLVFWLFEVIFVVKVDGIMTSKKCHQMLIYHLIPLGKLVLCQLVAMGSFFSMTSILSTLPGTHNRTLSVIDWPPQSLFLSIIIPHTGFQTH